MHTDINKDYKKHLRLIQHSELLLAHSQMRGMRHVVRVGLSLQRAVWMAWMTVEEKTIVSVFSSLQAFDPRGVWVITGLGIITGS